MDEKIDAEVNTLTERLESMREVEVYDQNGVNKALNKPASQSSAYTYDYNGKTVTVDAAVAKKDTNGDGHISIEEMEMDLEFKRKELEDADARRDAMRQMAWFSLFGMLLYPFAVVIANWIGLDQASKILGDMAATYFVSVAAIVMGFFGANAYADKKK